MTVVTGAADVTRSLVGIRRGPIRVDGRRDRGTGTRCCRARRPVGAVPGLWRAKGFVLDGHGDIQLVRLVGGRATVTKWLRPVETGTLVCIGVAGQFGRARLGAVSPDSRPIVAR